MPSPVSTLAPVLTSWPVLVVVRVSGVGGVSLHFSARRRSSSGGGGSAVRLSQCEVRTVVDTSLDDDAELGILVVGKEVTTV